MAAGVHDRLLGAGGVGLADARGIGDARPLLERQPVHVGAKQNGRASAVAQHRDDAGAADAGGHFIAERAQLCAIRAEVCTSRPDSSGLRWKWSNSAARLA